MIAFAELAESAVSPIVARGMLRPSAKSERPTQTDEQKWIARTLAGDLAAFNRLVAMHERTAYSVAYRILQSREAAADVVQESLLKAYRALPTFRNGSFKSWLLRIVVNTSYDLLRAERRFAIEAIGEDAADEHSPESRLEIPRQLVDSGETPHALVERGELAARIELGLRALPPEQRMVLVLHDIQGYRYEEIADLTGSSLGTVKSRLHRARQSLRDFLLRQPDLLPDLVASRH